MVNCVCGKVRGELFRWQGEVGCLGREKAIAVGRVGLMFHFRQPPFAPSDCSCCHTSPGPNVMDGLAGDILLQILELWSIQYNFVKLEQPITLSSLLACVKSCAYVFKCSP